MNKRAILGLAVVLLFAGLPAAMASAPGKPPPPVSVAALVPPGGPIAAPVDIPALTTGFEAAEGFSAGYCAQNGWTAFSASAVEGQISLANPYSGAQHLRISFDPAVAAGTNIGCFSPDIGAQPVQPNNMSIYVAISGAGGADYFINPQAPSQGLTTARVRFEYMGNIWVLDDLGSGAQWVDTGVAWNVGPYTRVDIAVDPGANTIHYSYGGTPIYTGVVFAGTTIEQVVLFTDNWNIGDYGDFDSLQVQADPSSVRLASSESRPAVLWPMAAALATILLLGSALGVLSKRIAVRRGTWS